MGQGLPNYTEPTNSGNFFSRAWFKFFSSLWPPQGMGNATFGSGYLQYAAPQGGLAADPNFEVGTLIPNPSGTPAPCLLLGSGGGNGTAVTACIVQDQAFDATTPGNNLIITAGETQPAGTQNGGELSLYGGASYGGTGGALQLQGGTSLNGTGGSATLQGGNSTNGVAGDAFISAGENGTAGANVQIIMTEIAGTAGSFIIRVNSTTLLTVDKYGAIFIGSGGCGTSGQSLKSGGPGASVYWG